MLLQDKQTGSLFEIVDVKTLVDPTVSEVPAQDQRGQEEQEPKAIAKDQLVFPSGESLPRCWVDADYRAHSSPT